MFRKKAMLLLSVMVILSVIVACAPAEPEVLTVVETVEVEVEKVVEKEVEVEKIVEVEKEVEKIVEVEKEVMVEVSGAIPYPEGAPLSIGREPKKFALDEMIVYKALDSYSEPDWVSDLVAAGELPPVEDRLPKEPQVFLASGMSTGLGEYGGIWRDFSACPTEGWNLGAGQTQGWFGINTIYQEALVKTGAMWMRNDIIEPMPNLAKSWEWSADGLELTMNLIEGAKWSDGEPFTSADVMFTWNDLILDDNVNSYTSRSTWQIDGEDITLEAIDDYTIKWTFPVPFPLQKMYAMDESDFHVSPEHIWAPFHPKYNADADYDSFLNAQPPDDLPVVSMGPWIPVEYKTDELMVMRRNPYYWKVDEAGKQLPYLDEVVFQKGTSGVGRTLSTMAGSGDHSNLENPGVFIETMKRQAEEDAHFSVEWGPETLGYYIQINQSANFGVENDRDAALRELFRDVRFRRALSQAIDRDGLAQAVVRGPFLRPWPGGIYPGSPYYSRDSVVYYPYSPDTARTLLADLGFEDTDGNGILNWTTGALAGEDLVIALAGAEDAVATTEIGQALVPLLAEVGIQINYRTLASTVNTDNVEAGTWEMEVVRGGQAYAVPFTRAQDLAPITNLNPAWHREGGEPRVLQPFEEELNAIVSEFMLEPDSDRRMELMAEFNRIHTENVYNIGVVIGSYGLALAERFNNVPVGSPVFLYQWTWGNVQPDAIWVSPENQLDQIRPNEVPVYQ